MAVTVQFSRVHSEGILDLEFHTYMKDITDTVNDVCMVRQCNQCLARRNNNCDVTVATLPNTTVVICVTIMSARTGQCPVQTVPACPVQIRAHHHIDV